MPTVPPVADLDRLLDATPAGLTTDFNIPWTVIADTNDEAAAEITVWVQDTGYLDPDGGYSFIGTVIPGLTGIYNGGVLRLAAGVANKRVIAYSARAPHRTGRFLEGKPLPWSELDKLMDDVVVQHRDTYFRTKAALHIPYEDAADIDTTFPDRATRALKFVMFDAAGKPVAIYTLNDIIALIIANIELTGGLALTPQEITDEDYEMTANDFLVVVHAKTQACTVTLPAGTIGMAALPRSVISAEDSAFAVNVTADAPINEEATWVLPAANDAVSAQRSLTRWRVLS